MKIAFSGCRDYEPNYHSIRDCFYAMKNIMGGPATVEVLVGDCPTGVDKSIREHPSFKLLWVYEAYWKAKGNAAGPIRNKEMIADADALIAFWDGKSKGTKNCIKCATDKGIPVLIMPVEASQ